MERVWITQDRTPAIAVVLTQGLAVIWTLMSAKIVQFATLVYARTHMDPLLVHALVLRVTFVT